MSKAQSLVFLRQTRQDFIRQTEKDMLGVEVNPVDVEKANRPRSAENEPFFEQRNGNNNHNGNSSSSSSSSSSESENESEDDDFFV